MDDRKKTRIGVVLLAGSVLLLMLSIMLADRCLAYKRLWKLEVQMNLQYRDLVEHIQEQLDSCITYTPDVNPIP